MATLDSIISKINTYKASLQQKLANKGVNAEIAEGLTALINHVDDIVAVTGDELVIDDLSYMFYSGARVKQLENILSKTSEPTNMAYAFSGCSSIIDLDLRKFSFKDCTSFYGLVTGCSNLVNILFSENIDTSKVTTMAYMFRGTDIETLDLSKFDFSSVTNLGTMFQGCTKLTNVLFPEEMDTSKVTSMSDMFNQTAIEDFSFLERFDTSSVTSFSGMLQNCSKVKTLDLSCLDTSAVTSYSGLRSVVYCSSLISLVLPEVKKASGTIDMFSSNHTNLLNITFKQGTPFDPDTTSAATLNFAKVWRGTADVYGQYYENFANSIGPVTSGHSRTIKIYTNLYNSLSDEQKALLIDKGYAITYGTT